MKTVTSNGNEPSSNMFTSTPSPTVTNFHSDFMHLNSPDRILEELKKIKKEITRLTSLESGLKQELENHFEQKNINSKYEAHGVMAVRQRREGRWSYSEFTQQFVLDRKQQIETQMAKDREDGTAAQGEPIFYWTIREEKK